MYYHNHIRGSYRDVDGFITPFVTRFIRGVKFRQSSRWSTRNVLFSV